MTEFRMSNPMVTPSGNNPWRYRRFWRLFRRKKPPLIDINYSYQYMTRFPRLSITVPPLVPTLMSYRWNDDDDYDLSPKNLLRHPHHHLQQQHIRRRFSKRYSDIVGPSSTKIYLPRKNSTIREKQTTIPSSARKQSRTSFKRNNTEGLYVINSSEKKSAEVLSSVSKKKKYEQSLVTRRYSSKTKQISTANTVDLLAHRMQVAMSTELMHSLDRNFVFGDKKLPLNGTNVNRSQSFHIPTQPANDWWEKSLPKSHYYHVISKVKESVDDERKSISSEEPTPDYEQDEQEIIIRPVTSTDIGEEPAADYDEVESTPTYEPEETSPTPYDLGVSSSFLAPLTSITPNSEIGSQDQSSIPPTPPPLPSSLIEQTKLTFRCRTIAERITPNHKLILKDTTDPSTNLTEENPSVSQTTEDRSKRTHTNPPTTPKPYRLHLSKELLEKTTLRKVSHPVSRSYSNYGSISQLNDHRTEPSTFRRKTSTIDEQSLDGLSSSATTSIVIDNEHEHHTSSKIYNDYKRRASLISVPTNNNLRSINSHSAIIHPMHTHIGLRSSTSSSSNNDKSSEMISSNKQMNICVINQLNQHLTTRFRKQQEEIYNPKNTKTIEEDNEKLNHYDEPQNIETSKTMSTQWIDLTTSPIPPPPPPLPVGGFRPVQCQSNRPLSSQRTSIMTLPRETNSTGTSTTSSKLSDTRILRELRTNPLFTKAKQHLEIIEPEPPNSSFSLDRSSLETFIISPDELDQTKTISSSSQSELERLFQKRAQRNRT